MSSKFRDGFLRLLHCQSLVKNRLAAGTRKGTFHTTSTNLSSSQSGYKRKSSRNREDTEYFDRSIKARRSVDHSVEEPIKIRIIDANSIVNGNSNAYSKDVIPEEQTTDERNDCNKFTHNNRTTKFNPKPQRLCNKSTSIDSDDSKPKLLDHSQTKYNNGHPKIDVETIETAQTELSFKGDSTMLACNGDNVEAIESQPNDFESEQLNIENDCNKIQHQHHNSSAQNGVRDDEYQSFLCRKRDLESLV